jgi:predicted MFS family arabinose efflux permease
MGLAMGIISAGHSIGAALGAFLGGLLYDLYAQYEWVWLSSLALAVLAGLMVFLIRERPSIRHAEAAA